MGLADDINKKLDEIIDFKKQHKEVQERYEDPEFVLEDMKTGKTVSKEEVLNKAVSVYDSIITDLNTLTNNGKNVRDIFTNQYYINNFNQDKIIAQEERDNKLEEEIRKQDPKNN